MFYIFQLMQSNNVKQTFLVSLEWNDSAAYVYCFVGMCVCDPVEQHFSCNKFKRMFFNRVNDMLVNMFCGSVLHD